MRESVARVFVLLITIGLPTFALGGCQMLGQKVAEEAEVSTCEVAASCCSELNQASAYNPIIEKSGESGWPNHCPSWNARSQQECSRMLDVVKEEKENLEHDHPVFDYEHCQP